MCVFQQRDHDHDPNRNCDRDHDCDHTSNDDRDHDRDHGQQHKLEKVFVLKIIYFCSNIHTMPSD